MSEFPLLQACAESEKMEGWTTMTNPSLEQSIALE